MGIAVIHTYIWYMYVTLMRGTELCNRFNFIAASRINTTFITKNPTSVKNELVDRFMAAGDNTTPSLYFLPFNSGNGGHWVLVAMDLSRLMVYYLDSLSGEWSKYPSMKKTVDAAILKFRSKKNYRNRKDITWVRVQCPQQNNSGPESIMKYSVRWQEDCDKDLGFNHTSTKRPRKMQSNDRRLHNLSRNQDTEMITLQHMQLAWVLFPCVFLKEPSLILHFGVAFLQKKSAEEIENTVEAIEGTAKVHLLQSSPTSDWIKKTMVYGVPCRFTTILAGDSSLLNLLGYDFIVLLFLTAVTTMKRERLIATLSLPFLFELPFTIRECYMTCRSSLAVSSSVAVEELMSTECGDLTEAKSYSDFEADNCILNGAPSLSCGN
ncbi:hypothetical protein KIW84_065193 [Lathyrus oleraceus]|uniref:Ubiquitin-like protease family profile domain-containing protein n=1 Tax=Pisum sativum TaxID=3888 RepID=A0A9D4WEN4_PEA|nr:hypothetical protein KIW84_065193 [Pisum sativum]